MYLSFAFEDFVASGRGHVIFESKDQVYLRSIVLSRTANLHELIREGNELRLRVRERSQPSLL